MQNLNINDGFKEFTINNDKSKVIRFNPSDIGILERINKAYKEIDESKNELADIELKADGSPLEEMEQSANTVGKFREIVEAQIDYIFDSPISKVVFGNQSPLSSVNGVPFYERLINAIVPVIKEETKKEQLASQKRIKKYTSQVK